MRLKNVHTGEICTEQDLVIHWEMDVVYDCLNEEGKEDGQNIQPFADWLRELLEEGDYEVVEQ